MRDLKFRAWINEFRWATNTRAGEDQKKEDASWMQYFEENKIEPCKDDCILMQFTGLQDKNGKDIYEGDIIRTYHVVGEVIEKAGSFGIMQNPQDFLSLFDILDRGDFHKIEIKGNIYENPDLLGTK